MESERGGFADEYIIHQAIRTAMLGSVEGEKAKKKRSIKMRRGRKRSRQGGGGRGGNTSGSSRMDKVRKAKIMTAEYLNMHVYLSFTAATFTIDQINPTLRTPKVSATAHVCHASSSSSPCHFKPH